MTYYLMFTFIVAVIAIIYVWYMTRKINATAASKVLSLETDENFLLSTWYRDNTKPTLTFDLDQYEIAARILHRVYSVDISPALLVLGNNLSSQYRTLVRGRETSDDAFFNLRDSIGKSGEIAIVHDKSVRETLRNENTLDHFDLHAIMEGELDILARDYLRAVLKFRWDKIKKLNDPNVLNSEGSFLYLRECNLPDVQTQASSEGVRLNLLCSDIDFNTLIKRWETNLVKMVLN